MHFDLVLPCDVLTLPNTPPHALTLSGMCYHTFFILWHALELLSYHALISTLIGFKTWEPTKSYLDYNILTKL